MTDSEHAADERLNAAVLAHARAFNIGGRDDELLSDFVIVAHWQAIIDQGRSRYTLHYSTPSIAAHIAFGLLTMGLELLRDHGHHDDDDDDDD